MYWDDVGAASLFDIATGGQLFKLEASDTKRYQCWYRTSVNPPRGVGVNDFNLSNGYEIVWLPWLEAGAARETSGSG